MSVHWNTIAARMQTAQTSQAPTCVHAGLDITEVDFTAMVKYINIMCGFYPRLHMDTGNTLEACQTVEEAPGKTCL